jgi:hypothetical protein
VPREGEHIGEADIYEPYTLRRRETNRPSRQLEDVLTSVTLKSAKTKFERREWATELAVPIFESKVETSSDEENMDNGATSRDDTEGAHGIDRDINTRMQVHGGTVNNPERAEILGRQELSNISNHENAFTATSDLGHISEETESIFTPVIAVDDEQSAHLLRPTIRHNLEKLDGLLMALHESRKACLRSFSDHEESASEEETGQKFTSGNTTKRVVGRPKKFIDLPDEALEALVHKPSTDSSPKKSRGRPRKQHMPLEGESRRDMLLRVIREQKKSFASAEKLFPELVRSEEHRSDEVEGMKPLKRRHVSEHSQQRSQKRQTPTLGLRDWSDVLGTAAIIGFDPSVVDRAAKRCAVLLGEGMSLRTIHEKPASVGHHGDLIQYTPGMIPDLEEISSDSDQETHPAVEKTRRGKARTRTLPTENISEDEVSASNQLREGSFYCPYTDCPRTEQGFRRRGDLNRHLRGLHRLQGKDLGQALVHSEDEMCGDLHMDRFLKPIRAQRGDRGKDTEMRNTRGTGKKVRRHKAKSAETFREGAGVIVQRNIEGSARDQAVEDRHEYL